MTDPTHPKTAEALAASDLFTRWWYYSMELLPGLVTNGLYAPDSPNLPRMMLRQCDLRGMSCLDMGTVEGLTPVLMRRGGASDVLAVDYNDDHLEKMDAVKHYHKAPFEYRSVGLMYGLADKLDGRRFDLINCSGLLYHVFSPLLVLAGLRALLKKDGLLLVSTNVICEPGFSMEFNNEGRMQMEPSTFWYLSVPLFDYMLRYLGLKPIDCLFVPHAAIAPHIKLVFEKSSGYLSVICRAGDAPVACTDDGWMKNLALMSWEMETVRWEAVRGAPSSSIGYRGAIEPRFLRQDTGTVDLWEAVKGRAPVGRATSERDTHLLRLSDQS